MKTLFTSEAVSKGGRSGTIKSPDGLLDVTLGNPLEAGLETRGPNPELLFAAAYSACYNGAITNAATRLGIAITDPTVRVLASLIEDDQEGYRLAVAIHTAIPGVEPAQIQRTGARERSKTCPRPSNADSPARPDIPPRTSGECGNSSRHTAISQSSHHW